MRTLARTPALRRQGLCPRCDPPPPSRPSAAEAPRSARAASRPRTGGLTAERNDGEDRRTEGAEQEAAPCAGAGRSLHRQAEHLRQSVRDRPGWNPRGRHREVRELAGTATAPEAQLDRLRSCHLVCWCAPLPCHGNVLLRLANAPKLRCD